MSLARYTVVEFDNHSVTLRDQNGTRSITNDAEQVVAEVAIAFPGRRIFYYDSMNRLDELVHHNGQFLRFSPSREQINDKDITL